jgi:hypothetical protein
VPPESVARPISHAAKGGYGFQTKGSKHPGLEKRCTWVMDVDEFDERLSEVTATFPAAVRGILLRVLTLSDEKRSQAIGEIYQDGCMPGLAELLMDLEADPDMKLTVERELRRIE